MPALLLLSLVGAASTARAQTSNASPAAATPSAAGDYYPAASGLPASAQQTPLGVPSMLGLQQPGSAGPRMPAPPRPGAPIPMPMPAPGGYGMGPMPGGPGMAMPGGSMPGMPAAAYGAAPASYQGQPPMMAGPQSSMAPPAQVDGSPVEGPYMDAPYAHGGYVEGSPVDGAYCPPSAASQLDAATFGLLDYLLPYGAGGWCAPRWFDVGAEAIFLTRDASSADVPLISDGVAGLAAPDIVLSTDDVALDGTEAGFRFFANLQFGATSSVEFVYFGTVNHAEAANVISANDNLFSSFSDFGNNPPPSGGSRGGFTDTDSAEFAGLEYSANIDSFELAYRRRWIAPNCRVQGSWLAGVRYFLLEESLREFIRVDYPDPNDPLVDITGSMDYHVLTRNSMTGGQLGGDLWTTLVPGVRLGAEWKGGIYYNRAEQDTQFITQTLGVVHEERFSDIVSFIGEFNFLGIWRVNENWTLRGGYQILVVDEVALAPANFNSGAPGVDRTVFIHDSGDVVYHGMTAGLEWMW